MISQIRTISMELKSFIQIKTLEHHFFFFCHKTFHYKINNSLYLNRDNKQ